MGAVVSAGRQGGPGRSMCHSYIISCHRRPGKGELADSQKPGAERSSDKLSACRASPHSISGDSQASGIPSGEWEVELVCYLAAACCDRLGLICVSRGLDLLPPPSSLLPPPSSLLLPFSSLLIPPPPPLLIPPPAPLIWELEIPEAVRLPGTLGVFLGARHYG
ncbi:hypothetical protein NHX12_010957, partial [Muraenolepis orangiensis]